MARNTLKLDLSGFNELVTKLEGLQGDVKSTVTDALDQAAETIEWDTKDAVARSNLPRKGMYSRGKTEASIVENASVQWSGTKAEIGVGFDYAKQGAGGILITGTPRMRPDYALQKMYRQKRYMKVIQDDMAELVQDAIKDRMEGRR